MQYKFIVSPKHAEKLKAIPGYKYASKVFNYKLPARYQWTEKQFVTFEADDFETLKKTIETIVKGN